MDSSESTISNYIRKNPGADFIAASIVGLIVVTFVYFFDRDAANEIARLAFFSMVAGVALHALTLRRNKETSR